MPSGIYAITNTTNGKQYVGSAVNIRQRWNGHRSRLRANVHHNPHMQNAWNKYGPDVFTFTILEECPVDQLDSREQYWTDTLDTIHTGYNTRIDTRSNRGLIQSAETIARRTARLREVYSSPALLERLSQRMITAYADPAFRARMSQRIQAALTPEVIARRSQSIQERYNTDPALRALLGEQSRTRWADPEYKARLSQSHKQRRNDPKEKQRQSRQSVAMWADPLIRQRLIQSMTAASSTPEARELKAQRMREVNARPEEQARKSRKSRELWADPVYKARQAQLIRAGVARRDARRRAAQEENTPSLPTEPML